MKMFDTDNILPNLPSIPPSPPSKGGSLESPLTPLKRAGLFHFNFLRSLLRDRFASAEAFCWQRFHSFFSIKILNQRKKSAHSSRIATRAQATKWFQNLKKNFDTENETALLKKGEPGKSPDPLKKGEPGKSPLKRGI